MDKQGIKSLFHDEIAYTMLPNQYACNSVNNEQATSPKSKIRKLFFGFFWFKILHKSLLKVDHEVYLKFILLDGIKCKTNL